MLKSQCNVMRIWGHADWNYFFLICFKMVHYILATKLYFGCGVLGKQRGASSHSYSREPLVG